MPKKRFFFPATTLIISFYFSLLFGLGVIAGYLATKFFHEKFIDTGKVNLIFINIGKWKIHLHHWITGILIIIIIGLGGWLAIFPKILLGSACGIALHDLHFDKEWYKVISKKGP